MGVILKLLKEAKALSYKDGEIEIQISPMAYVDMDKIAPKPENDDELLYYSAKRPK